MTSHDIIQWQFNAMYSWYRMDCTNPNNITNPVQSPCFKPVAVMASPCFSPSSERLCDSWSTRPSAVNKSWIPSCKASWALPSEGWKTLENDERKKHVQTSFPFLKPTKQTTKGCYSLSSSEDQRHWHWSKPKRGCCDHLTNKFGWSVPSRAAKMDRRLQR